MAALQKARRNPPKHIKTIERVLANSEKAFQGGLACIDTSDGSLVAGQTGEGLLPIGIFDGIPESGVTGNGTIKVKVRLFKEVWAWWFVNDTTPNAVTDAHVGSLVYVLDDQTVTALAAGNSVAGRVWAVDTKRGVLVEPAINLGPQGPQGEPG